MGVGNHFKKYLSIVQLLFQNRPETFFSKHFKRPLFFPHCLILLPEGGVAAESLGGVATVSNDDNVLSTPQFSKTVI